MRMSAYSQRPPRWSVRPRGWGECWVATQYDQDGVCVLSRVFETHREALDHVTLSWRLQLWLMRDQESARPVVFTPDLAHRDLIYGWACS